MRTASRVPRGKRLPHLAVLALASSLLACRPAGGPAGEPTVEPASRDLILATTTSTQDSGLLDLLVPMFEEQSGLRVKTVAVGTGEALKMAGRGDADVVLAHAPALEREMIESGAARNRRLVMHNDFVIVGPAEDPAGVGGMKDGAEALQAIAASGGVFVSRGDNSGTHFREQQLWEAAGVEPAWEGYLEAGQGMGATLMIASDRQGYALSDRGTFLAQRERAGLTALVEGDARLLNLYSVMEANPDRFPHVNGAGARAFGDFLLSAEVQELIRTFGVARFGEPLFFPDGGKSEEDLAG